MPSKDNFSFQVQSILHCLDEYSVSRDDLIELLVAIKFNNHYGCIPESTHIKLVNLFCRSSGRIQEIIHAFRIKPVNHLLNSIVLESNLFKTTPAEFSQIIRDLNDNGYAQLPFKLPPSKCAEILEYSSTCKHYCLIRNNECTERYEISSLDHLQKGTLSAHMYESDLISSKTISDIFFDKVIMGIASFYLRTDVCLHHGSLWHSYKTEGDYADSELAQLFHFDLDEFRWLKLFIFLTDVSSDNGPHVYIPGSHVPGTKSLELLSRGYARIPDDDMNRFHSKTSWKELTCPAGTLVFADTRCWHKGTSVNCGQRSILQPEYSPSTFSKRFF